MIHPNHFLSRAIRLLYPHGQVRRVRRGPMRGARFIVTPGMGATYAWGVDTMNFKLLREKIPTGSVVYDVGANCGQMALFFSRICGPNGRVISLEPVPENFGKLRANLEINSCRNVDPMCMALGRDAEPKHFSFDPDRHTMGTFADSAVKLPDHDATLQVACTTMDKLLREGSPPPQFIKLDVEGSGAEVIAGAEETITRHRPAIYFEVHAATTESPELEALRELQNRWGYTVRDLDGTLNDNPGLMWDAAVWCEPPIAEQR